MTRHFRRLFAAIASITAIVLVLVGSIAPAAAHEGGGTMTVESAEPTDSGSVRYVVRLIWNNDGHPAAAADTTMTAVPVGADDTAQTPVTLEPVDDDGRFAATVEFSSPGAWTVRFTSITPEATLEVPQQVDPPSTTTSTAAPSTTSSEAVVRTTATDPPEDENKDEDGEASKAGTVVFVAVALVLASGAIALGRRQRQRRQAGTETSETTETTDGQPE